MGLSINRNVIKVQSKLKRASTNKAAADKINKALDTPERPVQVKSENIKTIEYDPALKDLTITFHKGLRKYVYYDVPKSVYARFITASSKGEFFHMYIKQRYKYAEVTSKKK